MKKSVPKFYVQPSILLVFASSLLAMILFVRYISMNSIDTQAHIATHIAGMVALFLLMSILLFKLNNDIILRKKAEAEIRDSETKYRRLIEDAGVTMFTCNNAGDFTYVNERSLQLTGFKRDELVGKNFSILLLPDWVGQIAAVYVQQARVETPEITIEFPIQCKNGEEKWVEQHAVLLYDNNGCIAGYQCVVKDITGRKLDEDSRRDIEMRFRNTLEKLGDNVWEHDFDKKHTYFSRNRYDLLGYEPSDYESNKNLWWDRIHPDDRWMIKENDEMYAYGVSSQHSMEYRMRCKDGKIKWILDRGVVTETKKDGSPARILGTHTDITEIKQAPQRDELRDNGVLDIRNAPSQRFGS